LQNTIINSLSRLTALISFRRKIQFVVLFILIIGASIAEVISFGALIPFLTVLTSPEKLFNNTYIKPILLILNINKGTELLLPITILFCVAILISGLMRFTLLWYQTKLSYAVGADFAYKTYRNALYQPYSYQLLQNSSEVITGLGKASNLAGSIILPFFSIISSTIILLMLLSTLFYINFKIAIISIIVFLIIYYIIIQTTKKRLSYYSNKISTEYTKVIKVTQEGLGGIRDILIDGSQEAYCQIFRNADMPTRKAQANILIIGSSPRFAIEVLGMILIAILAYSMSSESLNFYKAIPTIGALALGAQRMLPIVQLIFSSWTLLKGNEASLNDALVLLEQSSPELVKLNSINKIPFNKEIILKNISFKYTKDDKLVLDNINLNIIKGTRVGIIGTTGSGKSTLLDLIMGLLFPTTGKLLIDGVEININNSRSWQLHIAHVPQAIYLSDSSIAENIAFGVSTDKINYEKVKEAAKKANIAESIESWKDKYKTIVGERGVRISGGQRQRIGIARALYKNADILVFDEATSALDTETENNVMDAIESLGDDLTIIIVAHRVTTLKKCNSIISLKNGQVEKISTYDSLTH
jgi:ABC-type multidrug transport system fused ATPase/permease subunit